MLVDSIFYHDMWKRDWFKFTEKFLSYVFQNSTIFFGFFTKFFFLFLTQRTTYYRSFIRLFYMNYHFNSMTYRIVSIFLQHLIKLYFFLQSSHWIHLFSLFTVFLKFKYDKKDSPLLYLLTLCASFLNLWTFQVNSTFERYHFNWIKFFDIYYFHF